MKNNSGTGIKNGTHSMDLIIDLSSSDSVVIDSLQYSAPLGFMTRKITAYWIPGSKIGRLVLEHYFVVTIDDLYD